MNISLLRNSALVHTHTVRRQGKILMRKFISSFGDFSVKAFTNRDIVGLRIWLTPPLPDLPYQYRAQRSLGHHQATVAAMPWPHPTARASRRRILPRLDEFILSKCSRDAKAMATMKALH
jgi:hypothetical protein